MSAELKTCPFCGASAEQPFKSDRRILEPWRVCCSSCTAECDGGATADEAVANWNRRAASAALYPVPVKQPSDEQRKALEWAIELGMCDQAKAPGRRDERITVLRAMLTCAAPAEGREAVDERAAFTRLQRDYDSLKSLCANAEVAAAEAQAELKKARAALTTAPTADADEGRLYKGYFGDKHPGDVHRELIAAYEEIERLKSAPTMSEGAGDKPAAWIRMDHLRQAQQAPFMCRVEPTYRPGLDLAPIFLAHPASEPLTDAARPIVQWQVRTFDGAQMTAEWTNCSELLVERRKGHPDFEFRGLAEIERIERAGGKA